MSSRQVSGNGKPARWMVFAFVVVIVALSVGAYFLIAWAGSQFPWLFRILLVAAVTAGGYLIGRAVARRPEGSHGPNWIAIGHAAAALLLAGYFGMYQPAMKDRDRDAAFARLMAEGQAATEALEAATREMPDSDEKPMLWETRQHTVNALRRAIDWMDRYQTEEGRYTPEQRRELHDEFLRMSQASAGAREKIARWTEAAKKEKK